MNGKPLLKDKSKPKKLRKKTTKQLKKKLDTVFSEFIRRRDKGICATCGNVKPWKFQQNAHYISRSALATRYDERNCHCGCVGCNIFKKGNMPSYTLFLQRKYGNKIIEILYKLSKVTIKNFPYGQLIIKYENEIKRMDKEQDNYVP